MVTVLRYVSETGHEIVTERLLSLNDKQARARIEARFFRLATGSFGDCKPLRDGVRELCKGASNNSEFAQMQDAGKVSQRRIWKNM